MATLGTVVAWTPALAQTAQGLPTDGARHIAISPQVVTTYDTNVSGTDAAGAAARRLKPEDVFVEPSVTIDGLLPVSRETIFLVGLVGYDFYDRNPVLNREHVDLSGGVSARLARCLPRLTGSYARSQLRLAELLPGPNGTTSSPQNASTLMSVGFDMSCPGAQGLSPTISVSHSTVDNSSKLFQATSNNSTSVQGGLSYARPGIGAIQTFGSFTTVAYDNPFLVPFPPFQVKNNYDLYAGGVSYDRPIGSRLNGSVSVSYSSLRPELSSSRGFSGVTYRSELSYKASSRLALHALVSRAMVPTNQVGAAYIINNARQIDAGYSLGTRWKLAVGASDNPNTYQGGLVGRVPGLLTNGRTDRVFGSVNLALSKRMTVVLNASGERRSSNLAVYNYTSDRVSLTLTSVF